MTWLRHSSTPNLAVLRRAEAVRRFGALLGVMALLIQVWVPLVHHPASFFGPGIDAWLAGSICHTDLGQAGNTSPPSDDGSNPAPIHKVPVCPICWALHACGTFVLPVLLAMVLALVAAPAVRCKPVLVRPARWTGISALPRAPPLMT